MREILFKAKRIDNGEWVEGLLWKKKYHSNRIFISCFPDKDDYEEVYRIDENTICQYTGLTDKNGNKIWENDVIKYVSYESIEPIGTVMWDKAEYRIFWNDGSALRRDLFFWVYEREIEVIGNIFDNPELLEGGEVNE